MVIQTATVMIMNSVTPGKTGVWETAAFEAFNGVNIF